jgi:UDP-N-acetylmuramate dehydrogenase
LNIEPGVRLGRYTTLGAGGEARAFARPSTVAEVEEALAWAREHGLPVVTIGLGSNLLVADEGVEALVLKLDGELSSAEVQGELLVAGGGAANAVCLHRARAAGLGDFEFACAIPGTAGGGVRMNAGAYGGDWSEILVRAARRRRARRRWRTPTELGLSYRQSKLGHGQVVGSESNCRLEPRDPGRDQGEGRRAPGVTQGAQPTNKRTFGSVFKNPDHELTAGLMLEGLRPEGPTGSAAPRSPRGTRTSSRTPTERAPPTRSH